mgnify:CR=1 FL=1
MIVVIDASAAAGQVGTWLANARGTLTKTKELPAEIDIKGEPPRIVRSMVEYWASELPFVSTFFARMGQVIGTPGNFQRLIERGFKL